VEQPKGPLVDGGKPNLGNLNAYLHTRSYIRGFTPSQDDVTVFKLLGVGDVSPEQYPHLSRWQRHVASFTADERAHWPA
jgi:elongation factor 1-beta